jgi:hypothetical protein
VWKIRRPFSALTALGAAAHHGYELGSGVGLVAQPELGLAGSLALWGVQLPVWMAGAARGGRRWDGPLALWAGMGLAGALVHFALWPWRATRLGVPALTSAEGLSQAQLPAYNGILWGWSAVSALAVLVEVPRQRRRWAVAGLLTAPIMVLSARHHFEWVRDQARTDPAWWNRAFGEGAVGG